MQTDIHLIFKTYLFWILLRRCQNLNTTKRKDLFQIALKLKTHALLLLLQRVFLETYFSFIDINTETNISASAAGHRQSYVHAAYAKEYKVYLQLHTSSKK